jgi:lysozyme family protein
MTVSRAAIAALALATAAPPDVHATEIPTKAASERPFLLEQEMTAENYPALFDRALGHEGGYTNDRRDPGNWTGGKVGVGVLKGTKFGIAANTFPNLDINNLTAAQARKIYKDLYWDKVKGDEFPAGIDWAVFDYAINSGPFCAIVGLQRALGVADDGKIGPVTLAAVQSANPRKLVNALCDERLKLVKSLKHWPTYKNGWSRRVSEVRAAALSMTDAPPTLLARAASLLKKEA